MTFREALIYILDHAEPHKLEIECVAEFIECVEAMQEKPIDYSQLAHEALYEWDI